MSRTGSSSWTEAWWSRRARPPACSKTRARSARSASSAWCSSISEAAREYSPHLEMTAVVAETVAGRRRSLDGDLDVRIDGELPDQLAVGGGTVLFVSGACFHRRREIRSLRILAAGNEVTPIAVGMPRRDVHLSLHAERLAAESETDEDSERDPLLHSYRSGFWALVPFGPVSAPELVELRVRAELDDGEIVTGEAGRMTLDPGTPRSAPSLTNGGGGKP